LFGNGGEISRFARNDNQRLLLQFLLRSWGSALGAAEAEGPESASRRGLFERSEFPRHLIRAGGRGTRRVAHGRKWFWVLLPKQKDLVCRGETLHLIISQIILPVAELQISPGGRND